MGQQVKLRKKKSVKKRVEELEYDIYNAGGFFRSTTKDRINDLERDVRDLTKSLNNLSKKTQEFEKVLYDANILEEIDLSDVKYREELKYNILGGVQVEKIPYVVNQVKVK